MQVGVAPQKLLFLGESCAANRGTGCNSDSKHPDTARQ